MGHCGQDGTNSTIHVSQNLALNQNDLAKNTFLYKFQSEGYCNQKRTFGMKTTSTIIYLNSTNYVEKAIVKNYSILNITAVSSDRTQRER